MWGVVDVDCGSGDEDEHVEVALVNEHVEGVIDPQWKLGVGLERKGAIDEGCNTIVGGRDAIDKGRKAVLEVDVLAAEVMGSPWMVVS